MKKHLSRKFIFIFFLIGIVFMLPFQVQNVHADHNPFHTFLERVSLSDEEKAELEKKHGPIEVSLNPLTEFKRGASTVVGWTGKAANSILLQPLSWVLVWLAALFAGIAGIFFDWMAAFSLGVPLGGGLSFYDLLLTDQGASAIRSTWIVLRDLVNLLFIFIVIYIGIMTILGLLNRDYKQILLRIVLVAIFINFSLVITSLVIDASNVLAIGFYNAFPASEDLPDITSKLTPQGAKSLSVPIMKAGGIKDLFDPELTANALGTIGDDAFSGDIPEQNGQESGTVQNIVTAILLATSGVIMITAGLLFLTRTVVLVVLMILSPLAFASFAIPFGKGEGYFKEWRDHLFYHAFWAPAFLLMYYVAVKIVIALSSVEGIRSGGFRGTVLLIVNMFIALGFMWASILVAQKMAGHGRAAIGKFNKRLMGYRDQAGRAGKRTGALAGRNTFGRAASAISDSDRMKKFISRNPRLGSMLLRPIDYTASAGFGGKKGYDKLKDEKVKRQADLYKKVAKNKMGDDLYSGPPIETTIKNIDPETGQETTRKAHRNVTAQERFIKSLGEKRSIKKGALSGIKRDSGGPRTIVSEKVTEKNLRQMQSKYGNNIQVGDVIEVPTNIGGRQTRADRETLLKIKKESGKSNWDKAIEDIKSEQDKDGSPQPPPPPPQSGNTPNNPPTT